MLYLVRHGTTEANLENRFAGRTDEPLHPSGIDQLGQLAERLAGNGIRRIVAGPLGRTRQTAAILGRKLGIGVDIDRRLNEIALPHWDGLSKDEIRQRFGEEYPTWLADPAGFRVPGCEAIRDVQQRAVAAVEELFNTHPEESLLVVSHLIVIRALILHYQGRPISDFRAVKVGNGEVRCLRRTDDGRTVVE